MGIEKGRPSEQSPKMKGIFYEAMQEKKLSESPKPLILLGFSKSSVSPLAPNNENPNLFSKEKGSDFLFSLRWDFLIYKPEVLYYNKVITQQEAPQNVPFD